MKIPRLLFVVLSLAAATSLVIAAPPSTQPVVKRPPKIDPQAVPASGSISPTTASPVTWKGSATGAVPQMGESGAIQGVNEDTFKLTLTGVPADWTGKTVSVKADWLPPAYDYDLYIHKANLDGTDGVLVATSAGGAPSTEEAGSIDPAIYGTGLYNVNVIYFTAPTPGGAADPNQFTGSAAVVAGVTPRTATYTHGGITFSPNSPLKCGTAQSNNEPSSRIDDFGNFYACGIRGVPAGVDLYYCDVRPTIPNPSNPNATIPNPNYDPSLRAPIYRGQPDATLPTVAGGITAGALGGGDIDLAVGFGTYTGVGNNATDPQPSLAYASLTAANVTYGRSLDRGASFSFIQTGNITGGVPVNDRQWMGFVGPNTVYLEYRNFANGIAFVQQSTDGGLNYGPALPPGGIPLSQTGAVDVDQFDGTVFISDNTGFVAVGTPLAAGLPPATYTKYSTPAVGANPANIFFPIRVAADNRNNMGAIVGPGTAYCTYSNGRNVFLIHSLDRGQHWSAPVQVNDPADAAENTNLMPWLATGPTPGSVGVVWYGTPSLNDINNDAAHRYRVYFAQTFNATSDTPSFRIVQASDHTNHPANISLSGLVLMGQSPNRNLGDYFQINFDAQGAAVIGYTDDHNDFAGFSFITRQTGGPSIKGKGQSNVPAPTENGGLAVNPFAAVGTLAAGTAPPVVPRQPGDNGEQVTDPRRDADNGLLVVTPTDNAVDILSIKYTTQDSNAGQLITATMRVSQLSPVPPTTTWRMFFAANAPELGLVTIAGNSYSKGLADRGDQFYIEAVTDANGSPTYNYGKAVRNVSGGIDTTPIGTADFGSINPLLNRISVTISTAKLNQYLTAQGRPTVGFGSTFCGLKGQAFQNQGVGLVLEDLTHGGTEFSISNPF